jgi:effector-binding domain-containing protein
MSKGFDVEKVDVEISKESMSALLKKYKKLKKFSKSNFLQIKRAGGEKTIIDELIEESKDYEL